MSQRFDKRWAKWIEAKRKGAGLTRKELALVAGIDQSYITLFERDGLLPSHGVANSLGWVFAGQSGEQADYDRTMLLAGYVPQQLQDQLLDKLAR